MTVKTTIEQIEKEKVKDDMSEELDQDKLAALRAKMAEKEGDVPPKIIEEKRRSWKLGVIGSGQAGSRIASEFHRLGYPAVCVNTALQDLEKIDIPKANKLLLEHGAGGAAKELDIGYAAAEAHRDAINELVYNHLDETEILIFTTSLGGGSGAGSSEVIAEILTSYERPVVVITVLPQTSDDAQTKHNAITTLSKFTKMVNANIIDNLIVVDNARIETIYSDVSMGNFFSVSNQAIVEPIDQFNTLSAQASDVKGLDSTELGKLLTDGKGLCVYGTMKVYDYENELAIAEAVLENVDNSMLASGFDLKKSRYVGAIFTASKSVMEKIPASAINYAMSMINDKCGSPLDVFKGIYTVDTDEDAVTVYSMFTGLGLPDTRIDQLRSEAKEKLAAAEAKDEQRRASLNLSMGDETVSQADALKKRISAGKSKFGKLHNRAVKDRRK